MVFLYFFHAFFFCLYFVGDGKLLCSDHDDLLSAIESSCITTPVVGPNDGRMTSSSASSAGSTPSSHSDADAEEDSGADNLVIDESSTIKPEAPTTATAQALPEGSAIDPSGDSDQAKATALTTTTNGSDVKPRDKTTLLPVPPSSGGGGDHGNNNGAKTKKNRGSTRKSLHELHERDKRENRDQSRSKRKSEPLKVGNNDEQQPQQQPGEESNNNTVIHRGSNTSGNNNSNHGQQQQVERNNSR